MSSGQKPRNPRYFPKMKVRGARRRKIAGFQRMVGAFDRLADAEETSKSINALTQLLQDSPAQESLVLTNREVSQVSLLLEER